jgi:hypothetical protein
MLIRSVLSHSATVCEAACTKCLPAIGSSSWGKANASETIFISFSAPSLGSVDNRERISVTFSDPPSGKKALAAGNDRQRFTAGNRS